MSSMTEREALLAAADYISSDGGCLDGPEADRIVEILRTIAEDYFGELKFTALQRMLSRAGLRLSITIKDAA